MSSWTFLTSHAQVLLCISANARITAREIAEQVGITERSVQRIIADLEKERYIAKYRDGRNNRYRLNTDRPMRHPAQRGFAIRELLTLVGGE
jgi:DNA-binding IclR family transcriptional regulator